MNDYEHRLKYTQYDHDKWHKEMSDNAAEYAILRSAYQKVCADMTQCEIDRDLNAEYANAARTERDALQTQLEGTVEHANNLIGSLRSEVSTIREQRDWMLDLMVDRWHDMPTKLDLHEWLEWTQEEYDKWLQSPSMFPVAPENDV